MAVSDDLLNFVTDQLSLVEEVSYKRMFGGVGIFNGGKMFGLITEEKFRLKANDSNREKFIAAGMGPLQMKKAGKTMPYWEVPVDIFEDKDQLKTWAEESIAIALGK